MKNLINNIKFILVSLLFLAFITESNATHIIGGDLTYRNIGGNQYEITLTLRRDCALGQVGYDDPASIGVFSGSTNALIREVRIPFNASDTINTTLNNNCGFEGFGVCVQTATYKTVLDLPDVPGGYIIAYQRCCRNSSLNNVINPLESGSTEWIAISNDALRLKNSSPRFITWPDIYICANKPLVFNHSAIDIDGDSLVYKICNPFDGASFQFPQPQPPSNPPYNLVQFKSPYSLNDMMGGTPLTIDPKTGIINANPNLVGQFLIGLCVEEYRNGVLLSTVRRDFQYNVRICLPPVVVDFNTEFNDPCDSLSYSFKNSTQNANSFEWNFNYPSTDPKFISTLNNPNFKFPQEGTYKVRLLASSSNGACDSSIIKEIVVRRGGKVPTSAIGARIKEICSGLSFDIFSKMDAENTYIWSPITGLDLANPSNPKFVGTQSTNYKVTITNAIGCSITDSLNVRIVSRPQPLVISGDKNACGETNLTVTGGNNSYEWSLDRDFKNLLGSSNSLKLKLNTSKTKIYVRSKDEICGIQMDSIEVVNQEINITMPDLGQICKGGSKSVTIVNNVADHNLTFTFSDVRVRVSGQNITINLTDKDTIPFNITGAVKNQYNCSKEMVLPIAIFKPQKITFVSQSKSCTDNTMCFTPSSGYAGTLLWNFGTGNSTDTSTMSHPCFKYSKPGNYSVKLNNLNTQCPFEEFVLSITVPDINDSIVSVTTSLDPCIGDKNVCFKITGKYAGNLEWNFGDANSGAANTSNMEAPCHKYSAEGIFTVTLKNTGTPCPFKEVKETVTIPPVFKINKIADQNVCEGTEVKLDATSNGTGVTYTWIDQAGRVVGNGPSIKLNPMSNTVMTLKGLTTAGCQDSTTIKINIFKFSYTVDLPATLCPKTDYQIKVNISNPNDYTYVWTPADLIVSGGTTHQPFVRAQAGKTISVLITDKITGCKETKNINPEIKSPIVANFSGVFCANVQSTLTLNISNPGDYTYVWSPQTAIVSGGNTNTPVVKVTQGQQIKVVVKHKTTGCEEEFTYMGQVQPPLVVDFVDPNLEIKQGKSATIAVKNPLTGATYRWNTGATGTSITESPTTNTTYSVTVTDKDGCTGTGQIQLRVSPVACTDKDEYLPNAFTPNGDGKNDILYVKSNVITELEFVIFNRWGQQVFSTTRIDEGWDGTFDGKRMAPDVYAYYIRATCISGDRFLKKGNVSLLK